MIFVFYLSTSVQAKTWESLCLLLSPEHSRYLISIMYGVVSFSIFIFMHAESFRFYLWFLSFQKNEVFDALRRYTKPANLWDLYAFSCDPSTIKHDSEPKWRLLREYFRLFRRSLPLQGVEEVSLCNEWWRLTRVNSSYSLCSTYPSELIVPRSIRYFHVLDNNMW
jgi:hypothetical protein